MTDLRKTRRTCVAIPTFRRSQELERLLTAIAILEVPLDCALEVLVMDNDPMQSAAALVGRLALRFPFALEYRSVPQPGLSSVRNFALHHARQGFEFLAMIDDDEIPQRQWLRELLRIEAATGADAVVGAVPHVVPAQAPRWLRNGTFFDLPVHADGDLLNDGYSGNCLVRVSSIERYEIAFDPSLNFAGGEDLVFFRDFRRRGATIAYAAHAVASEPVTADRLTAAYLIKLNFRRGNTLSLSDRKLNGAPRVLTLRALKAAARIARGCVTIVPRALLDGRRGTVAAACDLAHGLGALGGLLGYTYRAYARPGGASG